MSYKILFFTSSYLNHIDYFYNQNKGLSNRSYDAQLDTIKNKYCGGLFALNRNHIKLGNETKLVIVNCQQLQNQWAKENNFRSTKGRWKYDIALEQVKRYKPDIFYITSVFNYYGSFLAEVKKYSRAIFAQIACPLPKNLDLSNIDCIITSAKGLYEDFRNKGITVEYLRAGFDTDVLELLTRENEQIDLSFAGSLNSITHSRRVKLLKSLAKNTNIKIWGQGLKTFPLVRPKVIKNRYQGMAFGLDMYNILYNSKMTFNCHIDVAENYAGNLRLYEATGMGTLLITDMKKNLQELFEPGKEVVAYENENDLLEKVNYYMTHNKERQEIAKAGQERTLKDHNYSKITEEHNMILKRKILPSK